MKKINKKLMVILLSGFVLMTGCKSNTVTPKDTTEKTIENPVETPKNIEPTKVPVETSKDVEPVKSEPIKTTSPTPIVNADEQIKTYVNEVNNSIDSEEIKENAIKKFIILTDFIFYDGEIGGIKFNEITEEAKKEVLDTYTIIDNKINNKFPNYKDNIAEKYQKASGYVKDKYVELSDKLKDKVREKIGEETYNEIDEANKEIIEQDKENLGIIKEAASEATDKAKTKVKSWYEDLKNKY